MWITTNWKILQETEILDYLTSLLRNLYAGQKTIVRIGIETVDWFLIGTGVCQSCILSPAYLTFMQSTLGNVRLNEAQAGIKIAGRNINNLRYADDTTLKAGNEEELKSL